MRALVTGGNGFVGRRIVEMLLEQKHSVRVVGRNDYPQLREMGAECVQGDLRYQSDIEAAFTSIDTVFHVAAKVGLWGKRAEFEAVNIDGTRNVIACCKAKGVEKLVFTSSPSVIFAGESLYEADESLPYPNVYRSFYPETKAKAEQLVIAANGQAGLATCSLRPHLVWGPGDNHLIPGILSRARAGKLIIVGDGKNKVDFTYIDNVAHAHIQAAESLTTSSNVAGQCYFISQDEPVVFWDFVNQIVTRSGLTPAKRKIPLNVAKCIAAVSETAYRLLPIPGEPRLTSFLAEQLATSHHFSSEKAKRDFGYQPEVTMKEGIERTLRFLSERHPIEETH